MILARQVLPSESKAPITWNAAATASGAQARATIHPHGREHTQTPTHATSPTLEKHPQIPLTRTHSDACERRLCHSARVYGQTPLSFAHVLEAFKRCFTSNLCSIPKYLTYLPTLCGKIRPSYAVPSKFRHSHLQPAQTLRRKDLRSFDPAVRQPRTHVVLSALA